MKKTLLGIFILLLLVFNIALAVSPYAEVKNVIPEELQTDKPELTISLDLIECAPEKLAEYGIKYPEVQSSEIQADKDIRNKLSRLKKDKDIKIVYSTKITTSPDNKVIVDNRQPLEYLVPEEKNGATTFKKEIKYTGNFFEVNPTITKDGNISFDYHFWVGELKDRISNNKDIPKELGYPAMDITSTNSSISLENRETIILGGMVKEDEIWTNHEGVTTKKEERKALIICLGADIKSDKKEHEIEESLKFIELSREEMIFIATNKAKKIPYKLEGLDVIYDEGNKKWNEEWNRGRSYFGTLPQEYPPLTDRNYQAIYFCPKEKIRGAGVWFFIDKNTGEVIDFHEEAN